jgi:isopenicillin N synthase-like dioxygenase
VNKEKKRISIATFFNPKLEADVGCLKSLLSHENAPLWRITTMKFFSRNLNGKSNLI